MFLKEREAKVIGNANTVGRAARADPNLGVDATTLFSHGPEFGTKFGASMNQLHYTDPRGREYGAASKARVHKTFFFGNKRSRESAGIQNGRACRHHPHLLSPSPTAKTSEGCGLGAVLQPRIARIRVCAMSLAPLCLLGRVRHIDRYVPKQEPHFSMSGQGLVSSCRCPSSRRRWH